MSAATARRCAGRLASPRRASHRAVHHASRPHIRPWMRVPTDGWLLRDFLREALYNRDDGYFANASSPPVGAMSRPIPFQALLGQEDYARTLARRYDALASQWLTPVEIFKPHYARAVARHILRAHKAELDPTLDDDDGGRRRVGKTPPLRIYELGGGTGTCAAGILAHIRDDDPTVFASTEYVGVEISPTLAKMQRETVRRELGEDVHIVIAGGGNGGGYKGGGDGRGNGGRATYSVERRDALDAGRWGPVDDDACFVVALEVLDNLPHDRVMLLRDDARIDETKMGSAGGGGGEGNETRLAQTRVFARRRGDDNAVDGFEQREEPLRDPLISRALEAIGDEDESFFSFGFTVKAMADRWIRGARDWNARFVPTGALALLETLHERRPRHRLIAADFDSLPNVRVPVRAVCFGSLHLVFFIWFSSFGFLHLVFFVWFSSFGFLHLVFFVWFSFGFSLLADLAPALLIRRRESTRRSSRRNPQAAVRRIFQRTFSASARATCSFRQTLTTWLALTRSPGRERAGRNGSKTARRVVRGTRRRWSPRASSCAGTRTSARRPPAAATTP